MCVLFYWNFMLFFVVDFFILQSFYLYHLCVHYFALIFVICNFLFDFLAILAAELHANPNDSKRNAMIFLFKLQLPKRIDPLQGFFFPYSNGL